MAESVILIPVPGADPIVGKWRKKYDQVALLGIPSHITLLFPFKSPEEINGEVIKKLNVIFIKMKKFPFSLTKINTFPGVVFLEPSPKEKFVGLTKEIVKFFPENPPYGGKYSSINPHLTIGQLHNPDDTNQIKGQIAQDIENKLPVKTIAEEVWLMEEINRKWSIKVKFPFTD